MSQLFDSAFFAKLNNLKLAAHLRLDQGQSGARKSSAKGASVEFSDFREYLPGDDIRRIDWNAYGRLDRLYIKQFMEEKEATYHIFIDNSASMDFGEPRKSHMALQLAACFAWIVGRQLDRAEVASFHQGRVDKLSPVTGKNGFLRLLTELEQLSFTGTTGISEAVRRYPIQGKGICIILSDFLDPAGIDEAIRYLMFKQQEVYLFQILSPEELDFTGEGTLSITDMETGQEVRVAMTRETLAIYQNKLKEWQNSLEVLAKRYGCRFLSISSGDDLEKVIFETMHRIGLFT